MSSLVLLVKNIIFTYCLKYMNNFSDKDARHWINIQSEAVFPRQADNILLVPCKGEYYIKCHEYIYILNIKS